MTGVKLSTAQWCAYRLLLEARDRHADPHGVVGSGATAVIDSEVWINWQTAGALEARGLVEIVSHWDAADVYLAASSGGELRA